MTATQEVVVRVGRRGLCILATVGAPTIAAMTAPAGAKSIVGSETNPYSPANGHSYRHAATPTIPAQNKMNAWANAHAAAATGAQTLSYGGGVDGIGVQSGHSKVYLV